MTELAIGTPTKKTVRSANVAGFASDADRWSAVVRRDPAADGVFYYSVRTTGVYCLPSCAARLARRANVRFHATRADADAAGFRACKRCRPTEQGAAIHVAVGDCALGSVLVAASDKGVSAILLGDDTDALVSEVQARFPKAALIRGGADSERWVAQVVAYVEAPRRGLDLPLDIRGTAFQRQVWRALRDIPIGSTTSYADIAARIGAPDTARGVARACAANALAIAIPCHRVVRKDGGLSGYRWGMARKRALLDREAAV